MIIRLSHIVISIIATILLILIILVILIIVMITTANHTNPMILIISLSERLQRRSALADLQRDLYYTYTCVYICIYIIMYSSAYCIIVPLDYIVQIIHKYSIYLVSYCTTPIIQSIYINVIYVILIQSSLQLI